MPNGEDAIGNYTFMVEVDGEAYGEFTECSGISEEVQVIEHKANKRGGQAVIRKLPGPQKWGDITLKRGKTGNPEFWKWMKEVRSGKIDGARRNASIVFFGYDGEERARINLMNCWPSKVSIGSLQAGGSEITMEECTLVHEGLEVA